MLTLLTAITHERGQVLRAILAGPQPLAAPAELTDATVALWVLPPEAHGNTSGRGLLLPLGIQ